MIWESCWWKREIWRIAGKLKAKARQKRWTERSDASLEMSVFMAAYMVRKLIHAHKLSREVAERSIPVYAYPLLSGKHVTHMNWHKIDELYNLASPVPSEVSVTYLCNQFIHSYVFVPLFDESGRLSHLSVSSDHARRQRLFSVSIEHFIALLVDVAQDDVAEAHMVWSDSKGDYTITTSSVASNEDGSQ